MEKSFDNFLKAQSNEGAFEKCLQSCKNPHSPVIISGPDGCGKTHLLTSVDNFLGKTKNVCFLSCEKLVSELIKTLDKKTGADTFFNEISAYDVLLIDDCFYLAGRPSTQEELFFIIKKLCLNKKLVILATENKKDINVLTEKMINEFGDCIAEITPADENLRKEFLKKLCNDLNLSLDNEVLTFLSGQNSNFRILEGFIAKIKMANTLGETNITKEWVEEKL